MSRTRWTDRIPLAERRRHLASTPVVSNTARWRWRGRMNKEGYDLRIQTVTRLEAYRDVFSGDHDMTYCKTLDRKTENWPDVPKLRPHYRSWSPNDDDFIFEGPSSRGDGAYVCPSDSYHYDIPLWRIV